MNHGDKALDTVTKCAEACDDTRKEGGCGVPGHGRIKDDGLSEVQSHICLP